MNQVSVTQHQGSGRPISGEWPMLIICPNCATSYQVDQPSLGPAGRSVRCMRCRTVWFAANTAAISGLVAAHRAQLATASGPESGIGLPQPQGGVAAPNGEGIESVPGTGLGSAVENAPPVAETELAARNDPLAGPDPASAPDRPVVDSPPLAPIEPATAASPQGGGEDIETVAARRAEADARRLRNRLRPPGLPTAIVALAILDVGLIGWRADVVRWAPQMAPLYAAAGLPVNVRGLVFTDVTAEMQTQDGVAVLLVQGTIASTAMHNVEVPRLRFALRNESGNEIYMWTALANRSLLAPGSTLAFQSRLASPSPETRDVLVRFFNRSDLRAGIE